MIVAYTIFPSSKYKGRNKLSILEASEGHSQTEEHRWRNKLEH
jgi:hypothetical protein